jgi:hypothetical protein
MIVDFVHWSIDQWYIPDISIVENVFLALTNAMGSVLYYERLFKRIPPFQDNFASKFNMFRERCIEKHGINREHVELIQNVKEIILQHKKSPMEFTRNDSFVICSEDYKMKAISVVEIKDYLNKTKLFIQEASNIVSKNESIFNS